MNGPKAWVLVALASVATAATAAPPEPRESFDWCSEVAVRPDERRRMVGGRCALEWPDAVVAAAGVVLIGSVNDVPSEARPNGSRASQCDIPATHGERRRYLDTLRALRAQAGLTEPLHAVHMHRFDLVSASLAAEPGFDADFLVRSARPWRDLLDFFRKDRSPACGPEGCRFSLAPGGREDRGEGTWLSDRIDASGGRKRHESVVYYLARSKGVKGAFWPTAAVADLRNSKYRAWRVALARRALEIGGYDAIALNQKFYQYRDPYWLGSPKAPDAAAVRSKGNETFWSAPARDYGYGDYVAAWSALATDLRAAGVPYAITTLPTWPWVRDAADDPTTRRDEARMIRDVAKGARIVLLDRRARTDRAGLQAFAASLRAAGARVIWVDPSCGRNRNATAEANLRK